MSNSDDFNWAEAKEEGIVIIPEQAAIAVYENPNGDVVLRQAGQYHPDEDRHIYIHHIYLPKLIAALEQVRLKKQRET